MVKLLIENQADLNARDDDNHTALIVACIYGKLQ